MLLFILLIMLLIILLVILLFILLIILVDQARLTLRLSHAQCQKSFILLRFSILNNGWTEFKQENIDIILRLGMVLNYY